MAVQDEAILEYALYSLVSPYLIWRMYPVYQLLLEVTKVTVVQPAEGLMPDEARMQVLESLVL